MHPFDHLFSQVMSRKAADPSQSYTAKLLAEGTAKCATKVGEEMAKEAAKVAGGAR